MPGKSVKIAISLPREAYRAMEGVRRRRKTTRSALVAEAIEQWLSNLDTMGTIPKVALRERIALLPREKVQAINTAIRFALALE